MIMMQTKLYQYQRQQVASLLLVILSPSSFVLAQTTPNPTKSPTNLPTTSPILTSITGCPPLWSADNTPAPPPGSEKYQRGSIVSNPFAGSGSIRNVYECSTVESYYLFCPLTPFEPGNPTYQWEIAWTLLGSCDSSTPFISPTTSPTSAAPTFAVWSGTGCPREFDSSLLTSYELGDVVTYDTNDGQGLLVYECISDVIGRCFQGGYTPGEPFVNEAWSVLGTCTGTLTPTTSPTETVLAPWTLGGCPESFVSQTMYDQGDVVEEDGKVYECKGFPFNGLCGQAGYEPGVGTDYLFAWTPRGSCTGTLQPSPAPTTVLLPVWEKTGCPEEYDESGEVSYGAGDFVSLNSVVYKCTTDNGRCNQDGYEPESDNEGEAWDIEGSCTGTIAPTAATVLPSWSLGLGCPQEFQWGEDVNGDVAVGNPSAYEADTYVHVNERVYQCKDGVDAGFCKIHAPDGTFGYLGWIDLERSCDSSSTTVPQPEEEGGGGGGAITAFNTKAGFTEYGPGCPPLFEVCVDSNGCGEDGIQQDDLVSNPCSTDSSLNCAYRCKVASNCGRAGYEAGVDYLHYGALWMQDFTELGSCTSAPFSPPPASDVPQGDALPPWEFGGCPDAWDDSITYSGGDYVSSSSTVYKCKNGPNEQFCNLIPPEGLNGHSGSLGWEVIGSCTGTLDPLPAPTCGDIPTYTEDFLTNADWESEPQQVVNVDGTIYRCQTVFAAAAWCSKSQYDPTGMAGYLAWDTCTSCTAYEATGSLGSNCPDVAS